MKKVFIALLLTGCVIGCSKVSEISESKFDYALSTKVMSPVVEDGKLAVAILSGDTVYIGNVPGVEIEIPKYPPITTVGSSRSTGREDLEWHYIPNNTESTWHYQINRAGTLVFEDIPNGDNDYNDFVCLVEDQYQVNIDVHNGDIIKSLELSKLGVYPIALGNILELRFGLEIVRLDDYTTLDDVIIFESVRSEAFGGRSGFINTDITIPWVNLYNYNKFIPNRLYKNLGRLGKNQFALNYFIEVNGKRHYTADSSKSQLTFNKTPYGLYIPGPNNFPYPIEKSNISLAYPNFNPWLAGEDVAPFGIMDREFIYYVRRW